MARSRYTLIPSQIWPRLGPAFKGIDQDLSALEASGGGGTGTGGGVSSWYDLTDKPTLAMVATSGAYNDLSGKPAIPDVTTLAPKANPAFTGTVTGITKAMVGLGNVDNTADTAKSFAGTQITSGLIPRARLGTGTADASTVLFGDGTWKTAPTGGGGTVSSLTWTQVTDKPAFAPVATTGAYTDLTGRPTIPDVSGLAPKASPTFTGTVSGITKAMVGLGSVDNTADASKTFTAAQTTSGVFNPARLGTGTASASTVLYGDGTWKAAPAGGDGGGTDVTTRQGTDGSWPTITRTAGVHYRWFAAYDAAKLPPYASGARTGDELVTPTGTTVIA